MKISAIVCTRNRPELIGDCINALSKNDYQNLEILVIDQSTDTLTGRTVSDISREDSRIIYVPSATYGLSRARNIGIHLSRGDVVAFTDDDCIPETDWIERIAHIFKSENDVSAVYGRSLPWEKIRPGERPVAIKTARNPRVYSGKHNPWDLGHGNNMAFRRSVFDVVGNFDESLGPGGLLRNCDDADFTYRVLKAGYKALYSPEPLIYHKQFRHGRDLCQLEKDYGIGAGAMYMKHLRCNDLYMLNLILQRWIYRGFLYIAYGIVTAKFAHIRLGSQRIVYSLLGMHMARKVTVNVKKGIFSESVFGGNTGG